MTGLKQILWVLFMGLTSTLVAQKQVTGVVSDNSNVPIPGVNVIVKGTSMVRLPILTAIMKFR